MLRAKKQEKSGKKSKSVEAASTQNSETTPVKAPAAIGSTNPLSPDIKGQDIPVEEMEDYSERKQYP